MENSSLTTIVRNHVFVTNSTKTIVEKDLGLNTSLLLAGYIPIIVVTVLGNLLVIIAYCRYDQVRSVPTNALILSLSISDFLVGLLVLTFNLVWVCVGYWPFGELACRLWGIVDYTVTFMSTIAIILISFDRLLMVTFGPRYKVVWTRRRAASTSAAAWLFSTAFFTTTAFATSNYDLVDFSEECELEFVYNVPFATAILALQFVIPFPIIVVLNMWVYFEIYKRSRRLGRAKRVLNVHSVDLKSTRSTNTAPSNDDQQKNNPTVDSSNAKNREEVDMAGTSGEGKFNGRHIHSPPPSVSGNVAAGDETAKTKISALKQARTPALQPTAKVGNEQLESLRNGQRQLSRHRKAAITLCILVGTFVTCWLPYGIISIRQAMCGSDDCFSDVVWEAVNGLLWGNSALNPILYGFTNPQLRHHMLAWLKPLRTVRPL